MSDFEKSLSVEIDAIVQMFDFDGDLDAKCSDLLPVIGDDLPDMSRAYWDYWAAPKFGTALQNAAFRKDREAKLCASCRLAYPMPRERPGVRDCNPR